MASLNGAYVQVRIDAGTEYGRFSDAIYYSAAEFEVLTEEQVQAAKQERIDAWVAFQAKPSVAVEPSVEVLLVMKEELTKQLEEVNEKLTK